LEKYAVYIFRAGNYRTYVGFEERRLELNPVEVFYFPDGDSMFLQNIGIDLCNNTAPKPKTTLTLY
jgi:hypothetical protein